MKGYTSVMREQIFRSVRDVLKCAIVCICVGIVVLLFSADAYAAEDKKDYQIRVNRAANCVTVYEKDANGEFNIPVRAFVCSCGRTGHETPLGTFRTSDYYEWRLMVDGTYGKYAVRFNKKILFHSVPYLKRSGSSMKWEQYNMLGQSASLGCVRLACDDAKWIYENCKKNTEVIVYDDADNPGPLGKPEELKITVENPYKEWDPTDDDINNPWNLLKPSVYIKNDVSNGVLYLPVGAGDKEILAAVGLKSPMGIPYFNNPYKITISGNYDLNKAGIYQVSVLGINFQGIRAEKDMILCVLEQ